MDIRNRKELKAIARRRLADSPEAPRIALVFASIITVSSALSLGLYFLLGLQIDRFSGLSNLRTRSILASLQTLLPWIRDAVVALSTLGFLGTMLRVSRCRPASVNGMRIGLDRWWILLKTAVIRYIMQSAVLFVSFYLAMQIFVFTPMARDYLEIVISVAPQISVLDPGAKFAIDPATEQQLMQASLPMIFLLIPINTLLSVPLFYYYRMTDFVIVDKPGIGAFAALRESRKMMHRHCLEMFRLDLSVWSYYLLHLLSITLESAATILLVYGRMLLPVLDPSFSLNTAFLLALGLHLALDFAVQYFFRPHAEITFALAYDCLRPREQPAGGAVLGNIFDL